MNTNKKVIWITRTALFLAVAIVAQLVGGSMGGVVVGQLFTGILVNMALIIAGIVVGISSGCTIAILTPCLAFLFGIMKIPPVIPIVMLGNLTIVILTALFFKRFSKSSSSIYINILLELLGMIVAAFCKCAVLLLSVSYVLPLFVKVVPKQIVASFGIIQAVTGSLGGALALAVIPALLKAKKHA